MTSSAWTLPGWLRWAAVALSCIGLASTAHAAASVPDPCRLITPSELEPIVGPLKGKPRPGDPKAGDISCEYAPVKGADWVEIRLHDGDLAHWKRRNGGKSPVSLPDLGAGAFANPDSDGSAELFLSKGALILRLSMPTSPVAVEQLRKIAQKASTRL